MWHMVRLLCAALCAEVLSSNFFLGYYFLTTLLLLLHHCYKSLERGNGFLEERVERSLEQILEKI